MIAEGVPSILF